MDPNQAYEPTVTYRTSAWTSAQFETITATLSACQIPWTHANQELTVAKRKEATVDGIVADATGRTPTSFGQPLPPPPPPASTVRTPPAPAAPSTSSTDVPRSPGGVAPVTRPAASTGGMRRRRRRRSSPIVTVIGLVFLGLMIYRHTGSEKDKCVLVNAAQSFGYGDQISGWDKFICNLP